MCRYNQSGEAKTPHKADKNVTCSYSPLLLPFFFLSSSHCISLEQKWRNAEGIETPLVKLPTEVGTTYAYDKIYNFVKTL